MTDNLNQKTTIAEQVSAGGVAYRLNGDKIDIAIILTLPEKRWQLPKGIVDTGETAEQAAIREVREEAGINCELIEPIDTTEYWFYGNYDGTRKRYHKSVHFFLMRYISGDVADHDHEVYEARWVEIGNAIEMLEFESEKKIVIAAAAKL